MTTGDMRKLSDLADIINASQKVWCLVWCAFMKNLEERSEEKISNDVKKSDKIMKNLV